jgi:hypothetical protein
MRLGFRAHFALCGSRRKFQLSKNLISRPARLGTSTHPSQHQACVGHPEARVSLAQPASRKLECGTTRVPTNGLGRAGGFEGQEKKAAREPRDDSPPCGVVVGFA